MSTVAQPSPKRLVPVQIRTVLQIALTSRLLKPTLPTRVMCPKGKETTCVFLEEGGTCAILRQTSSMPTKPLCDNQGKTTETCNRAINWRSPSSNPIDAGIYPPMGEID